LLLDGSAITDAANAAGIAIIAETPAALYHAQHADLPKI
jgi:hypothetical protein